MQLGELLVSRRHKNFLMIYEVRVRRHPVSSSRLGCSSASPPGGTIEKRSARGEPLIGGRSAPGGRGSGGSIGRRGTRRLAMDAPVAMLHKMQAEVLTFSEEGRPSIGLLRSFQRPTGLDNTDETNSDC